VTNTPSSPDADEYLFRLDFAIRRMHSETWDDEDARKSSLFGLLTARALYTRPDEARNDQRAQLDEALAGPLVDEPGEVPEPDREPNGAYAIESKVVHALAVLVKAELVKARRGERTSPAAKLAAADLVAELAINASLDVGQLENVLREAL
jgi:hypothetical protein